MFAKLLSAAQGFAAMWKPSEDPGTEAGRGHFRALCLAWLATGIAILLVGIYPNPGELTMYQLVAANGLPVGQRFLASIEIAGPIIMLWRLGGFWLWARVYLRPH